jgi:hypothetical protein
MPVEAGDERRHHRIESRAVRRVDGEEMERAILLLAVAAEMKDAGAVQVHPAKFCLEPVEGR